MRKLFVFLIITLLFSDIHPQQMVIKLNEGFELSTFPPLGWKRINPLGAKVWERKITPLPPEIMQPPIQGNAVARIDVEYNGGDDWLISKKINSIESGDSLLFFLIKQGSSGPYPPDSLIIKVSSTDSLMTSFTNNIYNINIAGLSTGTQVWRRFCIPLTQFAGQNIFIAFQHKNTNGHGCAIDSITVFNPNSIGIKKINDYIPKKTILFHNFPNPFNPSTHIKFLLSESSFVILKIFDILGKEILTLVKEKLQAGEYSTTFNINSFADINTSSGVFFYKLITNTYSDTKAMILIK